MSDLSLLVGVDGAEVATVVRSPSAGHRVHVLDNVSPDALVVHQSRVFLFNLSVSDGRAQRALPRAVVLELLGRY